KTMDHQDNPDAARVARALLAATATGVERLESAAKLALFRVGALTEMLARLTGRSPRCFLRRLGYVTLGGVIALWAARVASGLTPQQATVRAPQTAIVRAEGEFLHAFPRPEAPILGRGHRDVNLDRYERNSPSNGTDPSGLTRSRDLTGTLVIVGGGS